MNYFITGGTGFIGKHLITELLNRPRTGTIRVLVRSGSKKKFNAFQKTLGKKGKKLVAVTGDLAKPHLGVTPARRKDIIGKVDHFFHLAAIYDLTAEGQAAIAVADFQLTE